MTFIINNGKVGLKEIACLTNIFEWYEFTIYSFLAVPIGIAFFNSQTTELAILNSLSVFALSYLVRPLGSIFFSYIGDKYHSSIALGYSMIAMAIPTALIGILPGYKDIGIFAPIALIILRFIQGFAAGGELPSCASFLYETSVNSKNHSIICSMTNIGGMIGVLLASFTVYILYSLYASSEIVKWMWRIPFILSIPLSIVIIRYRAAIVSSYKNKLTVSSQFNESAGLLWKFIKAIILITFLQVGFYILFVWMPIYLENYVGVDHSFAKAANVISLVALVLSTISFSYVSKYISYKTLILISAIGTTIFGYPLFMLLGIKSKIVIITVLIIFVIIMGPVQGNFIYALGNEFKCVNKNKLIALSYTLPTAFFGGSASYICSYFVSVLHCYYFPGIYLAFWGLLLVPAMLFL